MKQQHQHGFTLIELIIFIVVVGAGLAGILSVMNQVVGNSANPMVRKQAMALAESIMEEVMLQAFCDPDTLDDPTVVPVDCGPLQPEGGGRATFDDVDDYNGATAALFGLPPALVGYGVTVAVVPGDWNGIALVNHKTITVTVTAGTEVISVVSHRTNN